ncbi:transposase [Rhodococcus rhodochrous]|uniref:transposase n=1 Tax=Rhodococcus rhodochrous TaxID=1829 RepID=UPI0021BD0ED8|nr:transposase [Rhodococcus rhodochrous]
MYYRIKRRKRAGEFLGFLKRLRARWAGEKLYVVLGHFSPHRHLTVRRWAEDNDVGLVFLPTYGSWLNWIESEFAAFAVLRPKRHRSSQSHRAERCERVVYAVARCPCRTEDEVRSRLTDPIMDRVPALPGQGCVTRH